MTLEPIKFLLVDDTEENLVALEALLRRDGLELLKARSGSEALELLLVHDVALAILDVQMPEMNGFELAELMRGSERTRHVPIIFLTAGARDPQRVFKGYEAGAVDFLFKPIDPHVLRSKADVFFQLHQQKIELASNLRMNEMFVGILGHDLRNPLGAIVTGAQLLERHVTEEMPLRTLRRMVSSAERMRDMIEQLLDLTRARLAGGLGFVRARRPCDVLELVARAADELRGAAGDRRVSVSASGDARSAGDSTRLLQVFSNLLSNALHHGTAGTPVSVTVVGLETEIVIEVRNSGVIPGDLLPRIFDPFRGSRASSASQGLGLGLYISQQIIAAHDGTITVESSPETGTAFKVRLPKAAAVERPRTQGARRILVVEDDESIRETLREAFEDEGYEIETACNGQEALDILTDGSPHPDVAILDLVMPILDGNRLYQAMQADPALSEIPVIVSTSSPSRAPKGVLIVAKPVNLDRLLEAVADLWRER
ncbi:MAG TPA: response regulator [Polyangia bacterium]|nr:response regulator [Polyangia bacterium]